VAAAEEARRAMERLGLAGIVIDAAEGERLLTDPAVGPVLAYAAQAGVTVFAHPVNPPAPPPRFGQAGKHGVLLARGTESALSTLDLLASGVLGELGELRLVLAGIAWAALLQAPFLDPPGQEGAVSAGRRRLYMDTMGFDAKAIRMIVDVPRRRPCARRQRLADHVARRLRGAGDGRARRCGPRSSGGAARRRR
jgi:hypothetical protein